MRPKASDAGAIFQSIRSAAAITGLSTCYIRDGCKAGTIPHVRCGTDYRINLPLWLEQLNAESKGAGAGAE